MSEGKENFITVILVVLIITVIGGFGFVAFKIMEPSETNQNIANVTEEVENEIENEIKNEVESGNLVSNNVAGDNTNTVDGLNEENISNTIVENTTTEDTTLENVDEEEKVNLLAMKKYTENGVIKFQNNGFNKVYDTTRMLYNFEHSMYSAKFDYPSNFVHQNKVLAGNLHLIEASNNNLKVTISEINIEENLGIDTVEALGLVEKELKDYIAPLGDRYTTGEFIVEIEGEGNNSYRILTYNYSDGFNDYKCFSKIETGNPYMYVLTVAIPVEEVNDENIGIKNNILNSFEII